MRHAGGEDLTVGIMALVAQQERRAVSRRTREALQAARARGVRLGNPNGAEALTGIATSPWLRATLRYGAIVLAVLLFLFSLRRSGERAGRPVERLEATEKANDVQRRMLEAAARRPRDHHELAGRLRDGRF